ncbi:CPBP family intramembrane glutamic endopeptidase [Blattabacterium cuenoti]|uniref:CPBP family intramembrane glutamic endopeptidase n=1 Tax=Blattabacterium cuenoti TaxID=1653831 RepID=UPI00293B9A7C|nr:type II CAAX endopeptidase family protein [Blattabacterium cuenoti]
MNIKNYFKINYIESILLVLSFITINFFNSTLKRIFDVFHLSESVMFSISYSIPFIFLFTFIFYQSYRKKLVFNLLSIKISPWYIYAVIFFIMFNTIILNEYLSSLVPKDGPILGNMYREIEFFLKEEVKNPLPFLSTTVLLAPVCEEIFFRGIILNGMLKSKIHPFKAIIFSSFLFGLTHMNPWQLVGGLFIGTFIGYTYFITSSILDCILLHIFNNMVATVGIFYTINHDILLNENNPFYMNILVIMIGSIFIISGSYFLFRFKRKKMKKI